MNKFRKLFSKNHIIFLLLLLFLAGVTILFIYIKPEEIIEAIGVKNGYLIISFFALFGGFSAFTSVSFYATVIAFTIGGLNPFLLALVALPCLFIGDVVYYYFGKSMHAVFPPKIQKFIERVTKFLYKPRVYKFSPIFIFLYVGISPLPPDLLITTLSIAKYPFRKMIIPLLLGEATFVLLVSLMAQQGIRIFGI